MPSTRRTTMAAAGALAGAFLALAAGTAQSFAAPAVPHAATLAAPAMYSGYCGYYDGSRTTQRGDQGDRVLEIQCLINYWAGGDALDEDGFFGPHTENWVEEFQDSYGLQVDGIVGPHTWHALRSLDLG